ncbi:hypothetical protein [Alteromonas sp. P256]|uniref:hypothetical protein n=1 Tax=Alteromonas sp. P256 TaxID=3117399 RepID=UPI002FE23AB3
MNIELDYNVPNFIVYFLGIDIKINVVSASRLTSAFKQTLKGQYNSDISASLT